MATFDEKEFLWEEVYQDVKHLMRKKASLDEHYPEDWTNDNKKLNDFRDKLASTPHQEINYEQALDFFKQIENKYKSMPDKW